MTKYYQTSKFKQLNKKWRDKLKKTGFIDHEESIDADIAKNTGQTEDRLKTWSVSFFKSMRLDETRYKARLEYYQMASRFLHDYSFKNEQEQKIWELHSGGASMRAIGERLGIKWSISRRVINKLTTIMYEKNKANEHVDD